MNTLAKEIFKPKLFSDQHEKFEKEYPGFHQMIYDSMEEYAEAYAPVPVTSEEVKQKIEEECEVRYPVKNHSNPSDSPYVNSQKTFRHGCNFGYSLAAPVPGKEESVEKALEIWENNIPEPLAELLSDFAMNHTYPVRGVIRNLLSKIISECSPASPSTASNEDKSFNPEEQSRTCKYCGSLIHFSMEYCDENCKAAYDERNKAAKEAASRLTMLRYKTPNSIGGISDSEFYNKLLDAILAGASFNKDAVEFAEWIGNEDLKLYAEGWCQPGGSNGFHYTTQELYNLFKQIGQ